MMLGHLGAILAERDARRIAITDEGAFLDVSWQSGQAERERGVFHEAELASLRSGSWHRQTPTAGRLGLLEALGRKLDQSGMDVARIEEQTNVFQVSGIASGKYTKQHIDYRTLVGGRQPAPDPVEEDDDVTLVDTAPRFPTAARQPMPLPSLESSEPPLRRRLRLS
jgi:hypothetical protein